MAPLGISVCNNQRQTATLDGLFAHIMAKAGLFWQTNAACDSLRPSQMAKGLFCSELVNAGLIPAPGHWEHLRAWGESTGVTGILIEPFFFHFAIRASNREAH